MSSTSFKAHIGFLNQTPIRPRGSEASSAKNQKLLQVELDRTQAGFLDQDYKPEPIDFDKRIEENFRRSRAHTQINNSTTRDFKE